MDTVGLILAAGEGTRMKSDTAKVLHKAAGLPMIEWVYRALKGAGVNKITVVCGRAVEQIKNLLGDKVNCIVQEERKGSGHAVMCARSILKNNDDYTVIAAGDMPALKGGTIKRMIDLARDNDYECMLLTAILEDPFGCGRIVKDPDTDIVLKITEEDDADELTKLIKEVNASCYCVKTQILLRCLDKLEPKNAQGEYYLTDIVELINGEGGKVGAYCCDEPDECMGVNDRHQLAILSKILRRSTNEKHMKNGVTFIDPETAYIDPDTKIGRDTIVYAGVTLENGCDIGEKVNLYPGSRISNSKIGNGTDVQNSVVLNSEIGCHSTIGPNAYLRPGTKIGNHCRVGDFVEVKNSSIGDGTKVSHLTYIGDSDLGENINVGCGVVFVNYDGKKKYRSNIGDNVFIGCNTNIISPINIEDGAYIAAGTTITEDVPADSFVIGRSRQIVKTGWKDKRK